MKHSFSNFGVSGETFTTTRSNGTKTVLRLSRSSRMKTKACTTTTRPFSSWGSSPSTPVFTRLGKISDRFLPDWNTVNLKNCCFFSRFSRTDGQCSNYYVNIHVLKSERDTKLYGRIMSSNTNVVVPCPGPIASICDDFNGSISWKKVRSLEMEKMFRRRWIWKKCQISDLDGFIPAGFQPSGRPQWKKLVDF